MLMANIRPIMTNHDMSGGTFVDSLTGTIFDQEEEFRTTHKLTESIAACMY